MLLLESTMPQIVFSVHFINKRQKKMATEKEAVQ